MRQKVSILVFVLVIALLGCGDDNPTKPLTVTLGETSIVIVVNPPVNDSDNITAVTPGVQREGIEVRLDGGSVKTTDEDGVAVFGPVVPGNHTLSLSGNDGSGDLAVTIGDQDLLEIVVAVNGGVTRMNEIRYPFGGPVFEFSPADHPDSIAVALGTSNAIILLGGGTYSMDLTFSGSNLTLFGAGITGGQVTINGAVSIEGSNNRIRGAHCLQTVDIPGSSCGLVFSRVDGAFTAIGSSASVIQNRFCDTPNITGSDPTVLGNYGASPLAKKGC